MTLWRLCCFNRNITSHNVRMIRARPPQGFDASLIQIYCDRRLEPTRHFVPEDTAASAQNVVGSGSDGTVYWSLFNIER